MASQAKARTDSTGWYLTHRHQVTVSRATIHLIRARAGEVVPDPSKRPRSSYIRYEVPMRNQSAVRVLPLPAHPARRTPARTSR